MHKSIDPWRHGAEDNRLQDVLEKHGEQFVDRIEDARDLREYDDALALAKLLVVPDNKRPVDHTRDLSLAARKGYEANATHLADKQHQAARILAEYHGFDWKKDIIEREEERIGELGNE